jgi:hypothetical protein
MEALDGIYLTFPSVLRALLLAHPVSYCHISYSQNGVSKAHSELQHGQMLSYTMECIEPSSSIVMEALDGIYFTFPSVMDTLLLVNPVAKRHFSLSHNELSKAHKKL